MKDMFHNITVRPVIAPADREDLGTTPVVGTVIDVQGYGSLTYVIATGTLSDANATYAVLLEESDEDDTGFEAVADVDLLGPAVGFTFAHDGETRKLGYIGGKRYTRLTITPTGADDGDSPIAAVAILGHPAVAPVA